MYNASYKIPTSTQFDHRKRQKTNNSLAHIIPTTFNQHISNTNQADHAQLMPHERNSI